eukprot:CAMPEP_0117662742 /NCGR_PEP_ID=MMETSP0804-20121206/8212_1 /TAXON_ID=1074897 /ORGANISM="Tetraselmis astigmatica, Strain CCMP880" /LENGTH=408 /DNA_ID=CAMNT_0005469655 /DNA_START=74 /DNA_END=1303 /DNA_ORIENTATION=+
MPELVEVEAARRLCEAEWIKPDENKVITFPCPRLADDIPSLQSFLTGCTITGASRKGKQLAVHVKKGGQTAYLFVHLGMAGSIVVEGEKALAYKSFSIDAKEWPPKYTKIELECEGKRWAFCDVRRFGKAFLAHSTEAFEELAPDALLQLPAEEAWTAALARQRIGLKALLLDQKKLVSGIGNWIADEVLYQARLHPESPANHLSEEHAIVLRSALKHILEEACRRNGETFPDSWLFNYRWGAGKKEVQRDSQGNVITHFTSGGRTSAVVLAIQKKPPIPRAGSISNGAGKVSEKKVLAGSKPAPIKVEEGEATPGRAGKASAGGAAASKKRQRGSEEVSADASSKSNPKTGGKRGKREAGQAAAAANSKKRAQKSEEKPAVTGSKGRVEDSAKANGLKRSSRLRSGS